MGAVVTKISLSDITGLVRAGARVWPDSIDDYPGPLAGMLAGLAPCATPYLVTVACDSPCFPPDLVARLASELSLAGAEIATAYTQKNGMLRAQPVCCLMRRMPALRPAP